jgi:hypothetical protein
VKSRPLLVSLLLFFSLFPQITDLHANGFGENTSVRSMGTIYASLKYLCQEIVRGQTKCVESYDLHLKASSVQAKIIKSGRSKHRAKEYMRLSCSPAGTDARRSEIVCSVVQEFYCTDTDCWTPASALKIGDSLFTKQGPKKLTYVERVRKKIRLYMIEVEAPHTFFVGADALLTHNMLLPIAFKIGLDIAFGAGTAVGATVGSFFGPPTFVVGAAIGGIAGLITAVVYRDQIPSYDLSIGTSTIASSQSAQQSEKERPGTQFDVLPSAAGIVGNGGTPGTVPLNDNAIFRALASQGQEFLQLLNNHGISAPWIPHQEIELKGQSVEEAIIAIKKQLPDLQKFGNQSDKLAQYITNAPFVAGVGVVQNHTLPQSVTLKEKNGHPLVVFVYRDGNIVVREESAGIREKNIDGLPTIEVQPKNRNKQTTKIRLSG